MTTREPSGNALPASAALGWCVWAATALAVAWRLPIGLDLSDESYYAGFIDDWLKGSIASSSLSTLHQTAALIVYPLTRLYVALSGSSDGLFLALRALFLAGAALASLAWLALGRRFGGRGAAATIAAIIIAFVPFSLPAPSYNTLGQQGLLIGLAGYGCMTMACDPRARLAWSLVSAFALAIAATAYPPLALAVVALAGLDWIFGTGRGRYLAVLAIFGIALAAATVMSLSVERLAASARYLAQINDPDGFTRKLAFSATLLAKNPLFAALAVAATILGLARRRLPGWFANGAIALIVLATWLEAPALFVRSHDVVTLLALCGLHHLAGFAAGASRRDRLLAILFATSLAAGVVTTATATNAIYNSCIGLLPAALLALLDRSAATARPWPPLAATLACLAATLAAVLATILATTLGAHYGELPGPARQRIETGFFAGIEARPADLALLDLVRSRINPLLTKDPTIAVISRSPGLILATPARPKMLTIFPLMPDVPRAGLQASEAFYLTEANRPAVVLVYVDPYFAPLNPIGASFGQWYRQEETLPTPLGTLQVYRRNQAARSGEMPGYP